MFKKPLSETRSPRSVSFSGRSSGRLGALIALRETMSDHNTTRLSQNLLEGSSRNSVICDRDAADFARPLVTHSQAVGLYFRWLAHDAMWGQSAGSVLVAEVSGGRRGGK